MRLVRLQLKNWRGVEARDVAFADGVTVIEGPNEVGKSSMLEALRLLFGELDSSKKQAVKAVKPVGVDVGSFVSAEVHVGEHHFVFSKTFNKTTQTSLDILAPSKRQLSGREAHEAVDALLNETVDMSLWDALLIDQGEKIALADIQHSSALASALDEAAGSAALNTDAANSGDDSALFTAIEAEYEKFYSLKTAKPKESLLSVVREAEAAQLALEQATASLEAIEQDIDEHRRLEKEIERLQSSMPAQQKKIATYEAAWREIQTLQFKVEAKRGELAAAKAQAASASEALAQREQVKEQIVSTQRALDEARKQSAPLRERVQTLAAQLAASKDRAALSRRERDAAREDAMLAEADATHIANIQVLAANSQRVTQLKQSSSELKTQAAIVAGIKIDDASLEALREADHALSIAKNSRDAAATTVALRAKKDAVVSIDGEEVSLQAGKEVSRHVASRLTIELAEQFEISVTPAVSVENLQASVADAERALSQLKSKFGVPDLPQAIVANETRKSAQTEINRVKRVLHDLLAGESLEEAEQTILSLTKSINDYKLARKSDVGLPADDQTAKQRLDQARAILLACERKLDATAAELDGLLRDHEKAISELRVTDDAALGHESVLKEATARLAKLSDEKSDALLSQHANDAQGLLNKAEQSAAELDMALAAAAPEAAQTLLTNAQAVLARDSGSLQEMLEWRAAVSAALSHAQAEGRHEALDQARRHAEESQRAASIAQRQASAAQRLWQVVSRHRDSTRQAYVKPLKAAIEQLGRIVFSHDFEVTLGEDWSIQSRTLGGKTLAFDDLSIGAKEQLAILVRLAAAQIVSKQEGVPLIIDDALGFSDPARLETMGAAIAEAGKRSQVIVLTCTPGRFTHIGTAKVVHL